MRRRGDGLGVDGVCRARTGVGIRPALIGAAVVAAALVLPGAAFATGTQQETYVSANGSGTTCTFTAPCLNLATALDLTSPGGDIDILTSGSYTGPTITQSVTITAPGVDAQITPAEMSGVTTIYYNPITVDAPGQTVVLNGLNINGEDETSGGAGSVGTPLDGVEDESGTVDIENSSISGFTNDGVEVTDGGSTQADNTVTVENSRIDGGGVGLNGVYADPTNAPGQLVLDNDDIQDTNGWGVADFGSDSQLLADGDLIDDNGGSGVEVSPLSGVASVVLDSDHVDANGFGVDFSSNGQVGSSTNTVDASLDNDDIDNNGSDGFSATDGTDTVSNSSLSGNTDVAVLSGGPAAVYLGGDTITQNGTGLYEESGGTIDFLCAANSVYGNTTEGAPTNTTPDGVDCPSGPTGATGATGATGTSGATSASGPPGSTSAAGVAGVQSAIQAALFGSALTSTTNTQLTINTLLTGGGSSTFVVALEPGVANINWTASSTSAGSADAQRAKKSKSKPIVVASGEHKFSAAGGATIKIKLTAAGRRLLKHAKRLKLTATGTFTPTGKAPIITTKRFTLKR